MKQKNWKQQINAWVDDETLEALEYLRKNTPGGFNISLFIRRTITKIAIEEGWKPKCSGTGGVK